ncbi:MAG: hypothetical protein KBD50_00590 [Candidatus Pacebacteria bacterium]|nr:hypothetical protein [Candidatus Paceibacterota bacterium]
MTKNPFLIAALLIFVVLLLGGLYAIGPSLSLAPTIEPMAPIESIENIEPGGNDVSSSTDPLQLAPVYKTTLTTQFWVGEVSDESNGFIPNHESYWDDQWMQHFGGVDDPECRKGFYPCGFTPKENPFYVALPYGEYEEESDGLTLKSSTRLIPWFSPESSQELLKNRWVEVRYGNKTCYGQWQDVGPFLTDDFTYVFGSDAPHNTFGVGAGLDVSPALWDCLGLTTNEITKWRFVSASEVPAGPWKEIITTRGVSWGQ